MYNALQHLMTLLTPWEQSQLFRRNQDEAPLLKSFIFIREEKHAFRDLWVLTDYKDFLFIKMNEKDVKPIHSWSGRGWDSYLFWQWEEDCTPGPDLPRCPTVSPGHKTECPVWCTYHLGKAEQLWTWTTQALQSQSFFTVQSAESVRNTACRHEYVVEL